MSRKHRRARGGGGGKPSYMGHAATPSQAAAKLLNRAITYPGMPSAPALPAPRYNAATQTITPASGHVAPLQLKKGRTVRPSILSMYLPGTTGMSAQRVPRQPGRESSILEIMRLLRDFDPDASMAVWNWIRIGNPGHHIEVRLPGGTGRNGEAERYINEDLAKRLWRDGGGGADTFVNACNLAILTTGAVGAEVVPNDSLNDVVDVWPFGPTDIEFRYVIDASLDSVGTPVLRMYPARGGWRSSNEPLNPIQTFYFPLDPDIDDPYGRPPLLPAISSLVSIMSLLNEVQQVAHIHGYGMRDVSVNVAAVAQMAPEAYKQAGQEEALYRFIADTLAQIESEVTELTPTDTFVHFDNVAITTTQAGAVGMGLDPVFTELGRRATTALKTLPMLLGNSEDAGAMATVGWQVYVKGLKAVMGITKRLLENVYNLAIRIKGYSGQVVVTFNEIRETDRAVEASAYATEISNEERLFQLGVNSHERMSRNLSGHDPEGPPPPTDGQAQKDQAEMLGIPGLGQPGSPGVTPTPGGDMGVTQEEGAALDTVGQGGANQGQAIAAASGTNSAGVRAWQPTTAKPDWMEPEDWATLVSEVRRYFQFRLKQGRDTAIGAWAEMRSEIKSMPKVWDISEKYGTSRVSNTIAELMDGFMAVMGLLRAHEGQLPPSMNMAGQRAYPGQPFVAFTETRRGREAVWVVQLTEAGASAAMRHVETYLETHDGDAGSGPAALWNYVMGQMFGFGDQFDRSMRMNLYREHPEAKAYPPTIEEERFWKDMDAAIAQGRRRYDLKARMRAKGVNPDQLFPEPDEEARTALPTTRKYGSPGVDRGIFFVDKGERGGEFYFDARLSEAGANAVMHTTEDLGTEQYAGVHPDIPSNVDAYYKKVMELQYGSPIELNDLCVKLLAEAHPREAESGNAHIDMDTLRADIRRAVQQGLERILVKRRRDPDDPDAWMDRESRSAPGPDRRLVDPRYLDALHKWLVGKLRDGWREEWPLAFQVMKEPFWRDGIYPQSRDPGERGLIWHDEFWAAYREVYGEDPPRGPRPYFATAAPQKRVVYTDDRRRIKAAMEAWHKQRAHRKETDPQACLDWLKRQQWFNNLLSRADAQEILSISRQIWSEVVAADGADEPGGGYGGGYGGGMGRYTAHEAGEAPGVGTRNLNYMLRAMKKYQQYYAPSANLLLNQYQVAEYLVWAAQREVNGTQDDADAIAGRLAYEAAARYDLTSEDRVILDGALYEYLGNWYELRQPETEAPAPPDKPYPFTYLRPMLAEGERRTLSNDDYRELVQLAIDVMREGGDKLRFEDEVEAGRLRKQWLASSEEDEYWRAIEEAWSQAGKDRAMRDYVDLVDFIRSFHNNYSGDPSLDRKERPLWQRCLGQLSRITFARNMRKSLGEAEYMRLFKQAWRQVSEEEGHDDWQSPRSARAASPRVAGRRYIDNYDELVVEEFLDAWWPAHERASYEQFLRAITRYAPYREIEGHMNDAERNQLLKESYYAATQRPRPLRVAGQRVSQDAAHSALMRNEARIRERMRYHLKRLTVNPPTLNPQYAVDEARSAALEDVLPDSVVEWIENVESMYLITVRWANEEARKQEGGAGQNSAPAGAGKRYIEEDEYQEFAKWVRSWLGRHPEQLRSRFVGQAKSNAAISAFLAHRVDPHAEEAEIDQMMLDCFDEVHRETGQGVDDRYEEPPSRTAHILGTRAGGKYDGDDDFSEAHLVNIVRREERALRASIRRNINRLLAQYQRYDNAKGHGETVSKMPYSVEGDPDAKYVNDRVSTDQIQHEAIGLATDEVFGEHKALEVDNTYACYRILVAWAEDVWRTMTPVEQYGPHSGKPYSKNSARLSLRAMSRVPGHFVEWSQMGKDETTWLPALTRQGHDTIARWVAAELAADGARYASGTSGVPNTLALVSATFKHFDFNEAGYERLLKSMPEYEFLRSRGRVSPVVLWNQLEGQVREAVADGVRAYYEDPRADLDPPFNQRGVPGAALRLPSTRNPVRRWCTDAEWGRMLALVQQRYLSAVDAQAKQYGGDGVGLVSHSLLAQQVLQLSEIFADPERPGVADVLRALHMWIRTYDAEQRERRKETATRSAGGREEN